MSKPITFSTCIVIGIGGVTNGGKTTLCKKLSKHFENVTVFCMDNYYFPDGHPSMTLLPEFDNYANWEELGSLDVDKLLNHVQKWKHKTRQLAEETGKTYILFIEGIMILSHRLLYEEMDLKYFLTLPKEECWQRRSARVYEPPEPPGYFEKICWPWYLKYLKEAEDAEDIVLISGSEDQTITCNRIFEDIHRTLKSNTS